jgi:multicomponent Na+:H+ antiporter subunit G
MQLIGFLFVLLGVAFTLLGVIGIHVRLKDVFERSHAAGKVGTLGLISVLIGVAFLQPEVTSKVIILVVFAVLTAPAASHAIASAAHAQGVRCADKARDDLDAYHREHQRRG